MMFFLGRLQNVMVSAILILILFKLGLLPISSLGRGDLTVEGQP